MLYREQGPKDAFVRMRAYFAQNQKGSGGLFDLVSCFFCISIWAAVPFALFIATNPLDFLAYVLVLSGIASLINEVLVRIGKDTITQKGNYGSK
jgi:hypothetical protein